MIEDAFLNTYLEKNEKYFPLLNQLRKVETLLSQKLKMN